jgi:hypothetical protein
LNILELLFDKIGFVIVIVGFLLSMLAKARAQQGRDGRGGGPAGNPMMPPFGGPAPAVPDDRVRGKQAARQAAPAAAERREEAPRPQEERPAPRERGFERAPLVPPPGAPSGNGALPYGETPAANAREAEERARAEAAAENARRGLMWAEILGPPRAKNPYAHRK